MERMAKIGTRSLCTLLLVAVVLCAGLVDAQQKPLKVGFMLGLTGPGATIYEKNMRACQMGVEEINKSGGIMGRQIDLIIIDDESNPTKAVTIAKRLIEKDRVEVVIGPAMTATCVATTPIFTEGKIIQLISGTGVPLDVSKFPYLFRVAFGTEEQAQIMVDYTVDYFKKTKIGFIGDSSALGRNGAKDIEKVLSKRAMAPVGSEFFNIGDLDMTAQLKKLRDKGAEVVVLYAIGADLANVLKARKTLGWKVPVLGHIALALKGVLDLLGPELSEDVYSVMDKNFTVAEGGKLSPKMEKFREKVMTRYGKIDDTIFLYGIYYDPIFVYKYAVEKAGTTEADKVKQVMEQIKDFEGIQGTIRFRPDYHNGIWPEDMTVVRINTLKDGIHTKAPQAP